MQRYKISEKKSGVLQNKKAPAITKAYTVVGMTGLASLIQRGEKQKRSLLRAFFLCAACPKTSFLPFVPNKKIHSIEWTSLLSG